MIEISTNQVSPLIKSLFKPRDPAGLRCIAVLEGIRPGRIFSDNPIDPTWAVVWEKPFGAIYPGGDVSVSAFSDLIHHLRKEKVVFLGLWPDDPWQSKIGPYDQDSGVIDFYDRHQDGRLERYLAQQPEGTEFHLLTESLLERSVNQDLHFSGYLDLGSALNDLFGYFLMREDQILCEAIAGAEVLGTREIGVDTPEPYRQRGYATITCAKLIQTCEEQGIQSYWNCNRHNLASVALARKLGYQTEQAYKLFIWDKDKT
jgi:RimJ/RimL family protein N-acetyltransferase